MAASTLTDHHLLAIASGSWVPDVPVDFILIDLAGAPWVYTVNPDQTTSQRPYEGS
jgi:hypothetical protein